MGKLVEAVRKLGTKLTGKQTVESNSLVTVINDIADDYEGGGGGTSYTAGNGISINDNIINADLKVLEVSNITSLTTAQCNALKVGDVVVKITSNQKHTYTVSYKEDGVGMCLTYTDASTNETVSYDYTGGAWVYNSTDITPLKNVVANPTLAGTEDDLTGLQVGDTKYVIPQGGSGGGSEFILAMEVESLKDKHLDTDKLLSLCNKYGITDAFNQMCATVGAVPELYIGINIDHITDSGYCRGIISFKDNSGWYYYLFADSGCYVDDSISTLTLAYFIETNKQQIEGCVVTSFWNYYDYFEVFQPVILIYCMDPSTGDSLQKVFKVTKQEILDLFVD